MLGICLPTMVGMCTLPYVPWYPPLGTPCTSLSHSRRVYTEHAGVGLTALEHGVTERRVTVVGVTVSVVTVRRCYCC